MNPQNIKIPYKTFKSLLDVMQYIDLSNYAEDFQTLFRAVLEELEAKDKSIKLRETFAELKRANQSDDETAKFEALTNYLYEKNH